MSLKLVQITLLVCLLVAGTAFAIGPNLLSYQGQVLTTGGAPIANGSYPAVFAFFTLPTGGSPLWTESGSITTSSGLFSHTLGSVTPIPSSVFTTNPDIWLDVTVNGQPQTPRTQLTSAGNAIAVSTVDGATGGAITGNVSVSGNVGVGTTSPGAKLDVLNGNIRASSQLMSAGIEFYPASGGTPTNAGSIVGTGGSPNHIAIMPVGNVGIGTAAPTSKLEVVGDVKVSGNIIGSTPWTPFPFAAGYDNYEDVHGGGFQRAEYRKIGDIVYLRGSVHKADHATIPDGAILGTLPVGFRPPAMLGFSSMPNVAATRVTPSGSLVSFTNTLEYQYLDGIFFSTSP